MSKFNIDRPLPGKPSPESKAARTQDELIADLSARLAAAEDQIAFLKQKVEQLLGHTHELALGFQRPPWPENFAGGGTSIPKDLLIATAMGPQLDQQKRTLPPSL
jgi:hypothetical protein